MFDDIREHTINWRLNMNVKIIGLCLAFVVGATTPPLVLHSAAPTASVYGRVMDLFGTPLSDAVVVITTSQSSQKFSVRTKQDGSYLFRCLPVGEVSIVVKFQGFRPETDTVVIQADEHVPLDFGLEPGSIADQPPVGLSGTVQQSNKGPIKDATVTVVSAFNRQLARIVKTDNRGRYQVEFKNGGQYLVYASKPGFVVSTAAVVLPAAMPRRGKINLVLIPIRGSVYGVSVQDFRKKPACCSIRG
jgi:hypothetical protein